MTYFRFFGFRSRYWYVTFRLDVSRTTKRRRKKTQRTDNAIETYFCLLLCYRIVYLCFTFKHFLKNLAITKCTKDIENVTEQVPSIFTYFTLRHFFSDTEIDGTINIYLLISSPAIFSCNNDI